MRTSLRLLSVAASLALPMLPVYAKPPTSPPPELHWPKDTKGHYLAGMTVVSFTINDHGEAVTGCVTKSSGNASLDQTALRFMARTRFEPARLLGFPVRQQGTTPVPMSWNSPEKNRQVQHLAAAWAQAHHEAESCKQTPLPGVTTEALERMAPVEITLHPDADGHVPGAVRWDPSLPMYAASKAHSTKDSETIRWPTEKGRAVESGSVPMLVLLDKRGHVQYVRSEASRSSYLLGKTAEAMLWNRKFAAQPEMHWQPVTVNFRADRTALTDRQRLGMSNYFVSAPAPPPLPPPPPTYHSRWVSQLMGVTIHPGHPMPDGTPWPRDAINRYAGAEVKLKLTFAADGHLTHTTIVKSAPYPAFMKATRHMIGKLKAKRGKTSFTQPLTVYFFPSANFREQGAFQPARQTSYPQ